jgi:hypothetical protein
MRNAYKILVGKPEGEKPFGRPSRRWEHNIRMVVKEIEWDIDQWRTLVDTVMKLRIT